METLSTPVQVISCQGGVQLVSALAAAGWRGDAEPPPRRVLLIHDLYSPDGRAEPFAQMLVNLAEQVGPWLRIVHLTPTTVASLRATQRGTGIRAARAMLAELMGIDQGDELVLSQNHLPLYDLLAAAYPRARRTCYGDGLGVNFSAEYFRARPKAWGRWKASWRGLRRRLAGRRRWQPREQATYRLLLANRFDEALPRYERLDPRVHRELFDRMQGVLAGPLGERYDNIGKKLASCKEVVALLSSNFSETGRMQLGSECEAYEKFLDALEPDDDAGLIIKPHPRDAAEKIEAIRARLVPRFRHVEVLDDPTSFYLPFEIALDRIAGPTLKGRLRVACFSSSCLALHYLYGVPCLIGFGEETVRRHFPPQYVESRLRVERDLRKLLWELPPLGQKRAA